MAHAPARVVAVGVGDDGAIDRTPGIDVEITGWAVEAFGTSNDKIHDDWQFDGLAGLEPGEAFGVRSPGYGRGRPVQ